MQNLKNSNIYEIMPISYKTIEMDCIAYALSNTVSYLCKLADKTQLTANIEKLDDVALDYLAVELRTQYYSQSLTREQKIELIKGSLSWYMYAGTKKSLKEMVQALYSTSDVTEWYEYGGSPYHFKVIVSASNFAEGDIDRLYQVINIAKNARSILDEITLFYDNLKGVNLNLNNNISAQTGSSSVCASFIPDVEECKNDLYLGVACLNAKNVIVYVTSNLLWGGNLDTVFVDEINGGSLSQEFND